jgi:crossover junction endodeoxyribonuclease RuvC
MGIDPGLTRTGFAVVEGPGGDLRCLAAGTVATPTDAPTPERLLFLKEALGEVVTFWGPEEVAVERVFYNQNARTAVSVIQASGVALVAAAGLGCRVEEYTPLEVKQAVVGTGTASKQQVSYMVRRLVTVEGGFDTPDAADALAVAICHLHARRLRMLGVRM